MPFDGIVVKCIAKELSDTITGGRIDKIYQPERDEIIINMRAKGQNLKLLLCANASYPRIHLTKSTKENPQNPPMFCMILRKHLSGGKISGVEFHDFERIISIHIKSINELGDEASKKLVIEIMGKHSNIILVDDGGKIIDSIKHVDFEMSRLREIMPARPYTFPPSQDKTSPKSLDVSLLFEKAKEQPNSRVSRYLLENIKGFSPLLCKEVCFRAEVDSDTPVSNLSEEELQKLRLSLTDILSKINYSEFTPCIIWDGIRKDSPTDYHSMKITQYQKLDTFISMSAALDSFYMLSDNAKRLNQKKASILKILNNDVTRCHKKISLHQDILRETANRDKFRLYGELVTANIYQIPKNVEKVALVNYYTKDNEYIDIPLNKNLTPQDNAQRYFKKYAKARTASAFSQKQLESTYSELKYLESVLHSLESADSPSDIEEIRLELTDSGYLKSRKKTYKRKDPKSSKPYMYKSTDGFYIYVGKNNIQNDTLTLRLSSSKDIWLHTKDLPGSHVIIKKTKKDMPDRTLLEAALLAAYHSKGKYSSNVEVDYTQVKNVKKPRGAKPGMVIYDNHKTIVVTPDEELVNNLKNNI